MLIPEWRTIVSNPMGFIPHFGENGLREIHIERRIKRSNHVRVSPREGDNVLLPQSQGDGKGLFSHHSMMCRRIAIHKNFY